MSRSVFIVDGSRTPFLKARSGPGPFTPVDLAVQCGRPLLARQPFAPTLRPGHPRLRQRHCRRDEPGPVAALRLGMGEKMVAFTVQISAAPACSRSTRLTHIREGVSDLILGRREALSHAPLVWPQQGVRWFAGLAGAKGIGAKIMAALKARPSTSSRSSARTWPDRSHHRTQHGPDRRGGRPSLRHHPCAVGRLCRRKPQAAGKSAIGRLAQGRGRDGFARDGKFYDLTMACGRTRRRRAWRN